MASTVLLRSSHLVPSLINNVIKLFEVARCSGHSSVMYVHLKHAQWLAGYIRPHVRYSGRALAIGGPKLVVKSARASLITLPVRSTACSLLSFFGEGRSHLNQRSVSSDACPPRCSRATIWALHGTIPRIRTSGLSLLCAARRCSFHKQSRQPNKRIQSRQRVMGAVGMGFTRGRRRGKECFDTLAVAESPIEFGDSVSA